LNDTTFWATSLQANTSYFWRVAKEDFASNLFWSDTLSLTTADFYTTKLELDSVLTYQSIAEVALTIDSVFFLNGFQIELNYDNAEINYSGSVDSLFPNIQITDNNGILTLNWQDTLWHHAVNDTLIVLQFLNTGACKTPVDFSNVSFNYRGNAFFNNTITTKNGSIEYLNTVSPILIAPFDNQTDVYPVTAFVWSSVDCSVEYQLQVSESSDFSNIVLDTILQNAAFDNLILNHNSTYYWRVGRWDTQADRYWSNTLTFQTEVLPTVQVEVANIITYNDTMRVAISIDSLIWAESFDLVVEYDTIGFEYTGFSDTLFDMFVNEQNGAIMVQWMADSSSLQHWLNIDADTLVYLHFKNKNGCYTDLEWNSTATSFRYKSPNISIDNNNINGSIEWVNDDAPTLVFPPNDTLFLSTSFELSWNDVNCAESFAIQIATDSTFEDIVVEATNLIDLTYTAMNLERYTKYYWRVGQIDSEDTLHWSAIQNFQTDIENENDHWIFPNPTTDILNVWLNDESESSAEITIYNSIGQLMWTYSVDRVGKRVQLDLKPLDRGIYMIQFDDGVNKWVEKVVVY
ncbi:MAG: T9SS type A sorting domain-containing protein, partial [Saprospiraceae bacterium]